MKSRRRHYFLPPFTVKAILAILPRTFWTTLRHLVHSQHYISPSKSKDIACHMAAYHFTWDKTFRRASAPYISWKFVKTGWSIQICNDVEKTKMWRSWLECHPLEWLDHICAQLRDLESMDHGASSRYINHLLPSHSQKGRRFRWQAICYWGSSTRYMCAWAKMNDERAFAVCSDTSPP